MSELQERRQAIHRDSVGYLRPWERLVTAAGLGLIASGCAAEPVYVEPDIPTPPASSTIVPYRTPTAALETSPSPSTDAFLRQRVEHAFQGETVKLSGALVEYVARFPGDLFYATLAEKTVYGTDSYALLKNVNCLFDVLAAEGKLGREETIDVTPGHRFSPMVFRLWRPAVRVDQLSVSVSLGVPTLLTVEAVQVGERSAVCPEEPFVDLPGAREIGRAIGSVFWELVEGIQEGK